MFYIYICPFDSEFNSYYMYVLQIPLAWDAKEATINNTHMKNIYCLINICIVTICRNQEIDIYLFRVNQLTKNVCILQMHTLHLKKQLYMYTYANKRNITRTSSVFCHAEFLIK